MTQKYKSRHKGSEIDNAVDKVESLATVATTGSYNDLTDKPDIPSGGGGADITVDESLSTTSINPVQNKIITAELNKKGTYSKPNNGIPKSDLASDVQESLGKADTALQSYEEQYKGTVTSVKINGSTKNPNADGLVDLGNIVGDGEGGSVIVDEALSDTSTNPVQNKAIAEALKGYLPKTGNALTASAIVRRSIADANTLPGDERTLYALNSGVANLPSATTIGSHLLHMGWDINAGHQMWFSLASEDVYFRLRSGGAWGSWRQLLHSDNVRKFALPATGGTVTGNITATKFIGDLEGYANSAKAIKGSNGGVNLFDHLTAHDAENWAIYRGGEVIFRVATAGTVIGPYDKVSGFIALRTGDNYDYSGGREVRLLPNGNFGVGVIDPKEKLHVNGNIRSNDYLDAYGISLYETFATKTELEEALQGGGGNEVVSIKLTLNGSTTTTNINGAKVVVNNISKGTTATYSWAGNDITATVPAGDTFSVVCHACNSYAPPAEFSSVAIKGNNRTVTLNYITAPTGVYFCSNTGALTGSKDDNTVGIYVGSSSLKRVITPNKYSGYITGSTDSGSTNNSNGRVPTNNCTLYIGFDDIDYDPWLPSVVKGVSLLGKKCYIPASDEYSMLGSNKDAVTSYVAQFGNVYDHNKQAHFSSGFLYYGSTGPNAYYDEPIYAYSFGMVEY